MLIEDRIALVEGVLSDWKSRLGNDYSGYRNHVYRMINFCLAVRECSAEEREKIVIAGCFHDLGIWSGETFDYLAPSIVLAKNYLRENGREAWTGEIELMIDLHHKLGNYQDQKNPLVETFRRGDLVDFSLGVFKFGLPAGYVRSVKRRFPNAGFHRRLARLAGGWICRHPLNPLPVLKW